MAARKVKKKLDMLAEFGQLLPTSKKRLQAIATSTLNDDVTPAEHAALVTRLELEARCEGAAADREFAFARRWLSTPRHVQALASLALN